MTQPHPRRRDREVGVAVVAGVPQKPGCAVGSIGVGLLEAHRFGQVNPMWRYRRPALDFGDADARGDGLPSEDAVDGGDLVEGRLPVLRRPQQSCHR